MPQDGTTWNKSFKYLQDALDIAGTNDEIRVAGGSYRPDQEGIGSQHTANSRSETFAIPHNVTVKGGYAGLAAATTPDVRDTTLYRTILTGEIGNPALLTDNSIRVLTIMGDANNTLIDGLIIELGYADHNADQSVGIDVEDAGASPTIRNCVIEDNTNIDTDSKGAGIFFVGDGAGSSDVTLENCQFFRNYAGNGGALYCVNASPTVIDCFMAGNTAYYNGGAIYMTVDQQGAALFKDCLIAVNIAGEGNTAGQGGGVYCSGPTSVTLDTYPTFRDCEIAYNYSTSAGGGIYFDHAEVDVIGCLIQGNFATTPGGGLGGGMYVIHGHKIMNCTFVENFTVNESKETWAYDGYGGGLYADKEVPSLLNTLFHHNISGHGGGMYGDGVSGPAQFQGVNCTFVENTATYDGGGYEGYFGSGSPPTGFTNSIFWNNVISDPGPSTTIVDAQIFSTASGANVTYSCIMDDTAGDSSIPFSGGSTNPNKNIDNDPRFRAPATFNYRLKYCSPCINVANAPVVPEDTLNINAPDLYTTCGECETGERTPDLDLRDRVLSLVQEEPPAEADTECNKSCGQLVDMGSYEFAIPICGILGDVNGDTEVDEDDVTPFYACVASGSTTGGCACADMNGNNIVDEYDIDCFMQKLAKAESDCDGIIGCEETFYIMAREPVFEGDTPNAPAAWSWVSFAEGAVARATAETALTDQSTTPDGFTMATRWIAFESWVAAHPIESLPHMTQATYDTWAKLQLKRIVVRGTMP